MKTLVTTLYKFFLIPHVILYKYSKQKAYIDQDIIRWAKAKGHPKNNKTKLLLHYLTHSKDFRNIFYFRNRGALCHILNLYCPKEKYFKIDVNTKIKGGFLTGHPYSTIINANEIGENFYINHLVTIGEINGKKPSIGNNVSVYTGAIIIGDITIGNNCNIGAGAVVTKSVQDNCTVVGNPARVIKKKE
ncbi:serine acetyltransferase [Galbibacter sp. EGI 63066]|uniref:serine acetyltransferase n=1 Tax=Galbibacter sp. EGI 63066 TaxID=2993559 RepID=UPI002B062800|nr:serine acetyltransferase [Galbibacter sp. EGI 63066]